MLITFFCFRAALAQDYARIQGRVTDKNNGNPLSNTNVVLLPTKWGCAADNDGSYFIDNIPPGFYDLKASRIGFETQVIKNISVKAGEIRTIDIAMAISVVELDSIQIEAKRFNGWRDKRVAQVGLQSIKPREIRTTPGTFDDALRTTQVFASGFLVSDYNNFFAIRGGSPDQNQFIMDGVIIPNPYRFRLAMGGGMSLFDANITEEVRLHVGGFSAEFGNLLSSVFEIDTRDGNFEKFRVKSSLNLVDAGLVLEGPVKKGVSSFLLSFRRTYYDLFVNRLIYSESNFPNSTDFNFKFVYHINDNSRLSVGLMKCYEKSKLVGVIEDNIDLTEKSSVQSLSISWKNILSSRLQHEAIFAVYQDNWKFDSYLQKSRDYDYRMSIDKLKSRYRNFSLKEGSNFTLSDKVMIRRGFYLSSLHPDLDYYSRIRPYVFFRSAFPYDFVYDEQETYIASFVEMIAEISSNLQTEIGLRYDYSNTVKKGNLIPRITLSYQFADSTIFNFSFGKCVQYPNVMTVHLRDQAIRFPPHIGYLTPEFAAHYTIGLSRRLGRHFQIKTDFYYKKYYDLILPDPDNYNYAINKATGIARGIELFIKLNPIGKSRFNGSMAYSYGKAAYYDGRWIPFSFDRRHGLSLMGKFKIFPNFNINILWRIASGLPYTSIKCLYWPGENRSDFFIKDERHNRRFPNYQRLDIRLNYYFRSKKLKFSCYFDLINIYNHHNIYDELWTLYDNKNSSEDRFELVTRKIYMMPILPSVGFSFEF